MRLAVLFALGLGVVGCVTPSIPIPPPDPARMEFHFALVDQVNTVTMTYPPDKNYEGGTVYVFDHNTGMGVFELVKPDYSIGPTQPLPASLGDQVVMTIAAEEQTVSRCVVLRDGTQDPNTYCTF